MAQPPPRKGAYNKFVQNLHKDQFSKLQAKNQQELDLLDDIRNFMKQRAAIEKHYAEGLVKLSSVYGTKKIANLDDVRNEEDPQSPGEHNVYIIWRRMLEENEKIAKARLAAIQVFQENISDDAKATSTKKKSNSKKALDRLSAVQADVQISVSEVDRTKRIYFAEESDAIDVGKKVEDAELKAKGTKRDVISIFQSRTKLKSKALKLSAKQDESDIKSTGARNDYLLAVETANAHQDRYFHHDLQMTMRDMEYGVYEKMSEYFGTIARTELLTCTALQNSYTKLKDNAEAISRDYNYKCYTKVYGCLADHVQYAFEAVEGDTIDHITPSEHDDGYSLKYEARTTAAKLNQAIKTIRAFRKRIKACEHHKAAGLLKEPNDNNGPPLDEKIEELHAAIRAAETDLAKAKVRLKKLREGGVEVDSYLGDINLDTVQFDLEHEDKPKVATDWGSSQADSQVETPVTEDHQNYHHQPDPNADWAQDGGWGEDAVEAVQDDQGQEQDWAQGGGWEQQHQWNGDAAPLDGGWAQQQSVEQDQSDQAAEAEQQQPKVDIDPNADIWKAMVLFTFTAQNEDELTVTENEDIDVLVRECDEDGWVMARNVSGGKGYVPSNYIEVYASVPREETTPQQQQYSSYTSSYSRQSSVTSSSGQVVKQVSVESTSSWGLPPTSMGMPPIPETGPPVGQTSEEEEETEDDDDLPPGMAPPMGPPPTINVQDSDNEGLGAGGLRRNSRPVSINFGASLESDYCRGLYDYDANGPDELSFKEDDVIHIVSRNPNGVDDGWWMGECNGRTGLFPSIVVEESQADGSDWSPDVSICGSPPAFAPPPPSFEPPPPAMPPPPPSSSVPPQRPPAPVTSPPKSGPPPARPPVPKIVMASSSASPTGSSSSSSSEAEDIQHTSLGTSQTQIMITNPTPLVENENDPRDSDASKSYYVEDSSFSMNMTNEKKDKYHNSVPVEVNVVVEPMKPIKIKLDSDEEKPTRPPAPALAATEIVVTAPTPRTQSPTDDEQPRQDDQEPLFTCTSESESEATPAVQDNPDWASFGSSSNVPESKQSEPASDWANFGATPANAATEQPVDDKNDKQTEDWANFGAEKQQSTIIPQVSVTEPEPEPEVSKPEPEVPKPAPAPIVRPSAVNTVIRQVRIVETETSDFASDSESEVINTKLQVAAPDSDYGATTTDAGPDSSDTESDDKDDGRTDDDGKTTGRDSSDTESASEPEDNSRETPSPRPGSSKTSKAIPLPPEKLEPKQLKKLETMKESPA